MPGRVRGIVFDKDGTLFDFDATWGSWTAGFIAELAADRPGRADALADALDFDLAARRYRASSPVIAGTMEVVVEALARVMPEMAEDRLRQIVLSSSAAMPQVEAAPLAPLLDRLRAAGIALGVATNDAEAAALAHLDGVGIRDRFAFVAGYDSGHGGKPGAGMLAAFCAATGLAAADCLMVGDSLHDLAAGRAAGMAVIGVLTGPAHAGALAPFADAVLPSIAALPAWLGLGAPERTG